jgi:hypothetical protein
VLLGDSVFDNAAYVTGGPDVVSQLRTILPADCQASLLAVLDSPLSGGNAGKRTSSPRLLTIPLRRANGCHCFLQAALRHLSGSVSAVWMSAGPLSRSPSARIEIVVLPTQIGSTG